MRARIRVGDVWTPRDPSAANRRLDSNHERILRWPSRRLRDELELSGRAETIVEERLERDDRLVSQARSGVVEFAIRPQPRLRIGWRELWAHRELFYFFAWRDIKVRYKQAALGAATVCSGHGPVVTQAQGKFPQV